ncbi:hypothetical protein D9Q98_003240 [Chlorella vulgaris]|uniref:Uncharacterized protein n=1 Tax=Chlorella vulgaris TaxID=3077 RepID=A0A9D4TSL9_CHLVU|nr:hypothetical protein D9Q98_003240 [Chlorella vulgaris]
MTRLVCAASLVLLVAAAISPAAALSWPLCDNGGQVWVTERPSTEPTFPGANLFFFCDSGLNVLGVSIDPCIRSGTVCGQAVLDALCQSLGFDQAWDGMEATITNVTSPQEAVRSLTGEYCLREGVYSPIVPPDLESMPGVLCSKIDGITCVRNRETIITALDVELASFQPVPPTAEPVVLEEVSLPEDVQTVTEADGTPP